MELFSFLNFTLILLSGSFWGHFGVKNPLFSHFWLSCLQKENNKKKWKKLTPYILIFTFIFHLKKELDF